jgi:hypothetical protein
MDHVVLADDRAMEHRHLPRLYNPAYMLTGSVLFFIGFLELLPQTRQRRLAPLWASLLMGMGLCWVMQFHASCIALVPLVLAAFYFQRREKEPTLPATVGFVAGCLITGAFILPTYLKFGPLGGSNGATGLLTLSILRHPGKFASMMVQIVALFLSYASFAVPTFLRDQIHTHFGFFQGRRWLIPFFLFPIALGLLQPVVLLLLWFRREDKHKEWTGIKYATLGTVVILCGVFLFSPVQPTAHPFYICFPLAVIYSLYCWRPYLERRGWQVFAGMILLCGIVVQVAIGTQTRPHTFLSDAARIALLKKDYHMVGERREGARY